MADFEHLRAVLVGPVADLIQAAWVAEASDHVGTGNYRSYLSFERLFPYQGNDLAVAVANVAPYAQVLESGHAGFHLPTRIDWGAAEGRGTAHRSARGPRYLRVPFRHWVPGPASGGISSTRARGMMPLDVYKDAMAVLRGNVERGRVVDAAMRLERGGRWLSRPYAHGVPESLRRLAVQKEGHPGYTWRSYEYAGLRYRAQTNPETGRASGTYMTFRTLTEDSAGWFIPPFPGYHYAERVVERVRQPIRELCEAAAREDAVELLRLHIGKGEVP